MMKDVEDLDQQETNEETFEKWSAESFLLDEIERTPSEEGRLVRLYDYLQLLKDYDEELELE